MFVSLDKEREKDVPEPLAQTSGVCPYSEKRVEHNVAAVQVCRTIQYMYNEYDTLSIPQGPSRVFSEWMEDEVAAYQESHRVIYIGWF